MLWLFSKTDDGEIIELDKIKLKEFKRILAETDEKSIIWANYIHNIKEITQMLKETYGQEAVVSLYGEVSIEDRTDSVKRFQDDLDVVSLLVILVLAVMVSPLLLLGMLYISLIITILSIGNKVKIVLTEYRKSIKSLISTL